MNTLEYYVQNNYGKKYFYLIGENGGYINNITGKKTINEKDMENLKKVGFKLIQVINK